MCPPQRADPESIFVLADIQGWTIGIVLEVKVQYRYCPNKNDIRTDIFHCTVEMSHSTPGSSEGVSSLHTDLSRASEWRCEERRRLPMCCLFKTWIETWRCCRFYTVFLFLRSFSDHLWKSGWQPGGGDQPLASAQMLRLFWHLKLRSNKKEIVKGR